MDIVRTQDAPPVYEVQGFTAKDLNGFLEWLKQGPADLPQGLILDFNGTRVTLHSPVDRHAYAAGFLQAVDVFYPEPTIGKWADDDGDGNTQAYVILATSKNEDALRNLAEILLRELYLSKWPEHAGEEIRIHVSHDTLLLVRLDLWHSLSRAQKCEMVDRAKGFTDAIPW